MIQFKIQTNKGKYQICYYKDSKLVLIGKTYNDSRLAENAMFEYEGMLKELLDDDGYTLIDNTKGVVFTYSYYTFNFLLWLLFVFGIITGIAIWSN